MNEDEEVPVPRIETLEDAEKWIGVHQRFAVKDAERMGRIEERLDDLERRRRWRRRQSIGGRH